MYSKEFSSRACHQRTTWKWFQWTYGKREECCFSRGTILLASSERGDESFCSEMLQLSNSKRKSKHTGLYAPLPIRIHHRLIFPWILCLAFQGLNKVQNSIYAINTFSKMVHFIPTIRLFIIQQQAKHRIIIRFPATLELIQQLFDKCDHKKDVKSQGEQESIC